MPDEIKHLIEARGLSKSYDGQQAVAGIDFYVDPGEIFGFLGPNGAGKTTTINMLTGLARPGGGSIHIAGIDCTNSPKAAQHLMGIVPDESNLYPELTGLENLKFCGALYGMAAKERASRAESLIEEFGLSGASGKKFGSYSRGMKRKLTIAAGIIHSPKILFLDEPTTGIDIMSARRIRELISGLTSGGTAVFLTTHYIEEAERLCGRIAFIVSGRIVRADSTDTLMRLAGGRHAVLFSVSETAGICEALGAEFSGVSCSLATGAVRAESESPLKIGPLVRFIEDMGAEVYEARKIRPSLEEVFIRETGIESASMKKEKERQGAGK